MNPEFTPEEMKSPKYFYKYRSFDKNTIDNLINDTIYFSSLSQLNDPSEFNFNRDYKDTINIKGLRKHNEKHNGIEAVDNIKLVESGDAHALNEFKKKFPKIQDEAYKDISQLGFIFSACSNKEKQILTIDENLLLWSHYADSHKGLCIEYELKDTDSSCYKKDAQFKVELRDSGSNTSPILNKVIYSKDLPYLATQEGDINFSKIFFQKFEQWNYESEWRFISDKKGCRLLNCCFSKNSSIIFGCKMPQSDRETVIKIFETKTEKPMFKEAVFDSKENFLHIETLEI